MLGWLAAAAAGFYAASNIQVGLQKKNPKLIKAEKHWRDVVTNPQFLDAAGSCCSGLMAGLATSFGWWATIPIGVALGSAALVVSGKIGNVRLNTGIPMAALTGVGTLNVAVGILNGNWLAAISNVFGSNGEFRLTKFYNDEYHKKAYPEEPGKSRSASILRHLYRKEPGPSPQTPISAKPETVGSVRKPKKADSETTVAAVTSNSPLASSTVEDAGKNDENTSPIRPLQPSLNPFSGPPKS
jgi:hypothetical protein